MGRGLTLGWSSDSRVVGVVVVVELLDTVQDYVVSAITLAASRLFRKSILNFTEEAAAGGLIS